MSSRSKKHQQFQADLEQLIKNEFVRLYGTGGYVYDTTKIALNLDLNTKKGLQVTMIPPLIKQIRHNLRNLNIQVGAYNAGYVHCYLHESSECSHCRPDKCTKVMSGYQSNGVPEWEEFLDVLIDENPASAAAIFEDKRQVAAVYMRGRDLKTRLLSNFGKSSRTYNILGQVVCGFFSIRPSAVSHEKIDHIALSIQAVEHKPTSCHIALDLNIICSLDINNIMDYFADGPFHPIHRAFFKASKRIKSIELEINNAKSDQQAVARKKYMPMIPSILNEIRLEILRINHRYQRRTIHADKRIKDNRPVSRAIKDLMKIDSEFILEDPRNQTILVPGKNNRWHVFSRDGRLVTSLFLEKEQVQSRLVRKRWQKPDSEKIGTFILQIQKLYPGC